MENPGHVNCPHCSALNSARQGRCEACGASLEWATWKGPFTRPQLSKKTIAAACLLGGMAMGALGTYLTGSKPVPVPVPVPVAVATNAPQLDVVFAIDATGSMADEIDVVKAQVLQMMKKVQSGQPRPYVRFGLVAFRDRGDAYVTRDYPLTADAEAIQKAVNELEADGGGDTPEAVNEALHVAIQEMNWNLDQKTRRLVFLIGDAAPHTDYANDYDYRTELKVARERGIKVHAWGCSGIDESGQPEFQEIAELGKGEFQFLTYRQEVVRQDGSRGQVVFQGCKAYDVEDSVDWKVGADKLSRKKELDSSVVAAPSAGGGASYKACYAPAPTSRLENNLDRVLTEQVMDEARSAGTKY